MESLTIHCPSCRAKLSIRAGISGKPITCPSCGLDFLAPADLSSPTASPGPMTNKHRPLPAHLLPVELPGEARRAGDRLCQLRKIQQRARRAEKQIDRCVEVLDEAFASACLGMLDDGRCLQRVHRRREYEPLPAKVVTYTEYVEVPASEP